MPETSSEEPFRPEDPGMGLIRVVLAVLLGIHGVTRIYLGGVAPFGGFLDQAGFPFGHAVAWSITVFELVGMVLLLARRFVIPVSAGFVVQLAAGIILVHRHAGWFVVGAGRNGMEYSVMLIAGFLGVALSTYKRTGKLF